MQILEDFLSSETNDYELAELIIKFINCPHIRIGEFEGNEYVVKKIDRNCLQIFSDLTDNNGIRHVSKELNICREDLQKAIVNNGKKYGYDIPKGLLVDGLIEW